MLMTKIRCLVPSSSGEAWPNCCNVMRLIERTGAIETTTVVCQFTEEFFSVVEVVVMIEQLLNDLLTRDFFSRGGGGWVRVRRAPHSRPFSCNLKLTPSRLTCPSPTIYLSPFPLFFDHFLYHLSISILSHLN